MAKKKDDSLKNLGKTEPRKRQDGIFVEGGKGGPGRPKGSYTKSPLPYIEPDTFKSIAKTLSEKAIAGDTTVCLHLCPKPPSPPPEPFYCTDTFEIGPTETADQMMRALSRLREAYSKGEISQQYATFMENSLLATYKVYEASELMPTLKALQLYIKKHEKK